MWEKTLTQRLLLIGAVTLIGVWLIYPPRDKLRGGLDIEGGVSLIFEIQEEEGEKNPNLAEQMKRLLQKRVDPRSVYDLKWRVMGNNRLEIQMPLPPDQNKQLKEDYVAAREALLASNIRRGALEEDLRKLADKRAEALKSLAGDSAELQKLLDEAAKAYDEYVVALNAYRDAQAAGETETAPTTQEAGEAPVEQARLALRDAEENREDAIDAVLDTNFDDHQLQTALEMEANNPRRDAAVEELKKQYPALAEKIADVVEKHNAWRSRRALLEGPADLMRLLRGAGVLEFRILAEPSPENITKYDRYREQLDERGPRPQEGDTEQWFKIDNPLAFFNLDSPAELENLDPATDARVASNYVAAKYQDNWYVLSKRGAQDGLLHVKRGGGAQWRLKRAGRTRDSMGRPAVSFTLDAVGGDYFGKLTSANIDKPLCILVDDVAYSAPNINSRITTDGIITGDFSLEKTNYLIQTLQAGSLPARLKDTPLSERTIGSSLGHENLSKAFRAGVAGVIAVGVIMAVYYFMAGMIANVALVMNVLLVLAAMAMLGARFTLAGIAGVILTIGMTVDANVLIFERMREEKERGSSLRMIIKNGYDKAFSTIIDANITTLLICLIIYYVGSEEIKGFGLTLGWGIACSLFTALFVTRALFTLLIKYNLIKDIKMLHLIGTPKIDWYAKRKIFLPLSLFVMLLGLALLWDRGARDTLDVEFLGGVNAEVKLLNSVAGEWGDTRIGERLKEVGQGIADNGKKLADATVAEVPASPGLFRIAVPGVANEELAAMIREPLESADMLQRDGLDTSSEHGAVLLRGGDKATAESLQTAIRDLAGSGLYSIPLAGGNIGRANIGLVTESGAEEAAGTRWNITTTETNKSLVTYALVSAFGSDLDIQPRISFVLREDSGRPYPITARGLDACISDLPAGAGGDVTDYLGGAAMYFDELSPPQTTTTLQKRLRNMRLQPDYENMPWRDYGVFGVTPAGTAPNGEQLYSGVVVAVSDPTIAYEDSPDIWNQELATPEQNLARAAFDREQTLRKVTQFKPQIASQSQTRASMALLFSWAMIIGYLWIRFGRPVFGIAGVLALIHDVLIALAFVGISGWIGGANHPIGNALLINDFKIDMTIVAAFLTIIGYSINDTIVVFDRIRETRGRMGAITPQIINQSINQCLSRTLMTSITTFAVLLVMYIFGGSSIRGFNYCMMIGVITGTYSSIAVAAPLLLVGARRTGRKQQAAVASAGA